MSESINEQRLNAAMAHIEKMVYQATAVMEALEAEGRIRGNGHHARQAIA